MATTPGGDSAYEQVLPSIRLDIIGYAAGALPRGFAQVSARLSRVPATTQVTNWIRSSEEINPTMSRMPSIGKGVEEIRVLDSAEPTGSFTSPESRRGVRSPRIP